MRFIIRKHTTANKSIVNGSRVKLHFTYAHFGHKALSVMEPLLMFWNIDESKYPLSNTCNEKSTDFLFVSQNAY